MTEQREGTNQGVCLAPEILASYLDNRLTDAERSDVEAHLADCDDCRELVVDAFRTAAALDVSDAGSEAARLLSWRRRVWAVSGGLLAAAAVLVLVIRLDPEWLRVLRGATPGVPPQLTALVEAVGPRRYVEPRLTGGFAYGPVPSVTRSASTGRRVRPDVQIAILHIIAAAQRNPTPAQQHALGVARLIEGHLDEAVAALEPLARAQLVRPRVWSDLSAAYLARARERGTEADVPQAADAAQRATVADASLAEAWFNLALAREAAGQIDQARNAWRRYLALDQTSPWRAEAERHLQSQSPPP